jgi:hypothetical protein
MFRLQIVPSLSKPKSSDPICLVELKELRGKSTYLSVLPGDIPRQAAESW